VVGYCSRLDTLQAAVLGVKLAHLNAWNEARAVAAARYDSLIGDRLERVGLAHRNESVHHIYAIRVPAGWRDRVRAQLVAAGVGVGVHYPIPVHRQEAFVELGYGGASLPVAEQAGRELLSLPLFPEISEVQQRYVVDALFDALAPA
jgi:dTDP-4-amino-4,6-dideoxygalactose transaminase